eukprot:366390-Chlamydomonas_euryale.AAC.11
MPLLRLHRPDCTVPIALLQLPPLPSGMRTTMPHAVVAIASGTKDIACGHVCMRAMRAMRVVVFFENAFAIAISSYSVVNLYSYEHGYLTGLPDNRIFEGYAEAALVIACELLMLVFSSVYVLPMFALIAPLSSQCIASVFKRGMDTLEFQHDLGSLGSQHVDAEVHPLETLRLHTVGTTREQRSALSLARAPVVAAVASARSARMASLCSSITSRHALGGVLGCAPEMQVQPSHITLAMDSSVDAVKPPNAKAPPCCD